MNELYRRWLVELTDLPTAAGREGRVVAWVKDWAAQRGVDVAADQFGNLTLTHEVLEEPRGDEQAARARENRSPLYFTAHLDHPAFVVESVERSPGKGMCVAAQFRGGVKGEYFDGAGVLLHGDGGDGGGRLRGHVTEKLRDGDPQATDPGGQFPLWRLVFDADIEAGAGEPRPGDVVTWDVGAARIEGDLLHAPACDDLAGVAAALSAFDATIAAARETGWSGPPVRVLLTRAEEVGFMGAIAAAKHQSVPRDAVLVCLENSKSFPDSPIGGGPIVRVGDRTSTFNPELTWLCSHIAERIAEEDETFVWQRKLMPGGTCEASAFHTYGYVATCLCLPLGNYHNMDERAVKIGAEFISATDFHGLVRLLGEIALRTGGGSAPTLRERLDKLFEQRGSVLGG